VERGTNSAYVYYTTDRVRTGRTCRPGTKTRHFDKRNTSTYAHKFDFRFTLNPTGGIGGFCNDREKYVGLCQTDDSSRFRIPNHAPHGIR
jgi:hypothetical protein